jgi:hypothetical protein
MEQLLDMENRAYRAHSHPSILIGRRGAGKTAFLQRLKVSDSYIVTEVRTHDVLASVIEALSKYSRNLVYVETVADLWEIALWTVLFQAIRIRGPLDDRREPIGDYLISLGITEDMDPTIAFTAVMDRLVEKPGKSLAEALRQLKLGDVSFDAARGLAREFLIERKLRGVVLMDSIENFQPDARNADVAIGGLLKCLGAFHSPENPCELRFCLPSEVFQKFKLFSSNPNKDFAHRVKLHWSAPELIQIAARRFKIFLKLFKPALFESVRDANPTTKRGATAILNTMLPMEVTNRLNVQEPTLGYILRHTQLLPRHLLIYLNQIWQMHLRSNSSTMITEQSIRDGVLAVEQQICDEIFSAFHNVHPNAREVCKKCVPELPLRFTSATLHQVFTWHGKRAVGSNDFSDFKTLLIEIGAVGRVRRETEKYVEGQFEYTVPHSLVVGTEDELCLHPVFSQCYSARSPSPGNGARVVYPFGSDIDGEDWRDQYSWGV